ncbi:hypothetical protein ACJQWK_07736 [Exserohilum turcicum]
MGGRMRDMAYLATAAWGRPPPHRYSSRHKDEPNSQFSFFRQSLHMPHCKKLVSATTLHIDELHNRPSSHPSSTPTLARRSLFQTSNAANPAPPTRKSAPIHPSPTKTPGLRHSSAHARLG